MTWIGTSRYLERIASGSHGDAQKSNPACNSTLTFDHVSRKEIHSGSSRHNVSLKALDPLPSKELVQCTLHFHTRLYRRCLKSRERNENRLGTRVRALGSVERQTCLALPQNSCSRHAKSSSFSRSGPSGSAFALRILILHGLLVAPISLGTVVRRRLRIRRSAL